MENMVLFEYVLQGVTLLMFASGIPPVWQMYRTGNTAGFPLLFFLLVVMNTTQNICYGLMKDIHVIYLLNVVGCVLHVCYLLVYIRVCRKKCQALTSVLTIPLYCGALYYYLVTYAVRRDIIEDRLGLATSVGALACMVAPGLEVISIVRSGSARDVSWSLMLGGLLCSGAWLSYGVMLDDVYMKVPNVIGLAIVVVKIIVVLSYSGGKDKSE